MIADTLTRLQRALPAAQSGRLWEQLAAILPPDRQPDREQPAAIAFHDGNPDAPQDLIDIAIEDEQARQSRHGRREPVGLGSVQAQATAQLAVGGSEP